MSRAKFQPGEPVQVEGSCADEHGSVRGLRGRVDGDNNTCVGADGVQRVNVKLEDGTYAAVPVKAVRRRS